NEMSLVGVAVPTRAGIGRDLDLGKLGLALLDRFFLVVGVDEDVEIRREMLSLEREHVVDVRVHLEVGIGDRFLPELFPLGRQRLRLPFLLMSRRINLQQKPPASPYAPRGSNGKIALRWGGCSFAAMSCSAPKPEMPTMPTLPSHQGCAAIHSIRS